jgi:hypothetical protein
MIELNVGGTHDITAKRSVLCKVATSDLSDMFSGRHELKKDDKGKVFLDRDGKTFEHIISYLRNNLRISSFDSSFQKE